MGGGGSGAHAGVGGFASLSRLSGYRSFVGRSSSEGWNRCDRGCEADWIGWGVKPFGRRARGRFIRRTSGEFGPVRDFVEGEGWIGVGRG